MKETCFFNIACRAISCPAADEIADGSMTNGADSMLLEVEYENATNFSVGATTDNLPPGVLYRVKATYKYSREDVDELSFDVGEIIRVVEYDDPEEQVRVALFSDETLVMHFRHAFPMTLLNLTTLSTFVCRRRKAG